MVSVVRVALVKVLLLAMSFVFANDLCQMSWAELNAAKAKWETRIAEASGPHIPPDRQAEEQLFKIENEIRRRNGLPPLPPRAAPAAQNPPPVTAARPQSEHDKKVNEVMGKLALLERKRAWIQEQDAFSTEPDPELNTVEAEIEALTKELHKELGR